MSTTEPSWLEIDLTRLSRNVDALRARFQPGSRDAGGRQSTRICAVIKKDAYGLGAVTVAHRLAKCGVAMLAVYDEAEARELVTGAVTMPILVLSPMHDVGRTDVLYRHAVAGKLHLSIHDVEQAKALNQLGRTFGMKVPAHPYLDTGMARSGLSRAQFDGLLSSLGDYPFLRLAGVFTHMATGDDAPDFLAEQMDRFEAAVAANAEHINDDVLLHVANTFTTLRGRRYHLDMIRPGLGLYGYGPEWLTPAPGYPPESATPGHAAPAAWPGSPGPPPPLLPITRWLSRLTHVQRYPKGASIGYNRLHTLKRNAVVGVVPVGYGDGYPVALSNKGVVRLLPLDDAADEPAQPIDCPVLGKVSMDQITIDLTKALDKAIEPETLLGRTIEVYSNDPTAPNAVSTLAKAAGTHSYELQCRLSTKIKRQYVN